MDRRSFLATLVGGFAVATGGAALARPTTETSRQALEAAQLDSSALDETDAEFSHMPPGPRWRAHRAWHRRNWRRRRRRWRRRAWRRGRWYYYY
jgi:hypothetical protein